MLNTFIDCKLQLHLNEQAKDSQYIRIRQASALMYMPACNSIVTRQEHLVGQEHIHRHPEFPLSVKKHAEKFLNIAVSYTYGTSHSHMGQYIHTGQNVHKLLLGVNIANRCGVSNN